MSCTDDDAINGGGCACPCDSSPGAGVPSSDPNEPSFLSSPEDEDEAPAPNVNAGALGAPKENGRDFTGPLALLSPPSPPPLSPSMSGVLGGLPKPNPTGFPMLPALAVPNALKGEGFPGDADPNANGFDEDAEALSLSLSFSGVVVPVPVPPEDVPAPKGVDAPEPGLENVKGTGAGFLSFLSLS